MRGNRGEWSEVYAFLHLLSEGKLYASDSNLNLLPDSPYIPITRIIRHEKGQSEISYYITDLVEPKCDNESITDPLPREKVEAEASKLLKSIASAKKGAGAFALPETEFFVQSLGVNTLKAPAQDKSDITLEIHDPKTGTSNICGWSIKSELGNSPTLLNAGKTTNFIFELPGCNKHILESINSIDTRSKVKDRWSQITEMLNPAYVGMLNQTFERNLRLIDTTFPSVVAFALSEYYKGNGPECKDVISKLEKEDPLKLGEGMYAFKFKKFLSAVALGMVPAKPWNGREDATGGYIVVKSDGSIVAFHVNNHNEFEDYLLKNTRFETASTGRHEFGYVYEENGHFYFSLNLQIRFN